MGEFTASFLAPHQVSFLWLIPLFPALGALINCVFGAPLHRRFGERAVHSVAVGAMVLSAAVAVYGFIRLLGLPAGERALVHRVATMIDVGRFHVDLALNLDPLSGTMALIVTLIGTLIHIYSTGYMHKDPSYWRFFGYLNLFIFAMLLLVLGDSFVMMFFGWEGVGLCSYLLIGFWYKDLAKAKAGMKAFVVNRVGDFAFLSGLFLLFWSLGGAWPYGKYTEDVKQSRMSVIWKDPAAAHEGAGAKAEADAAPPRVTRQIAVGPTVSFSELRQQLSFRDAQGRAFFAERLGRMKVWGVPVIFLVCVLFFIGATGKSAQIPLYVWLPDAMAGPTPVSALIHAATMVTAGVYMVARLNFLFFLSPAAMTVVASVGALTALYAATIGLFQYDIKKVLAYSTISQLGYMFLGVGVGAWWAGVFHLLTHAAFKACLFLGSGSVIHGMHAATHHAHGHGHGEERDLRLEPDPADPQDMRNMGGLARLMPATRMTYLIACFAIAGFPWAAGFFSKDEILWKAFSTGHLLLPGWIFWAVAYAAAGMTAFYMFRSYYLTFFFRAPTENVAKHVHESPRSMTWVLWVLGGLSILTGLLGLPMLFTRREPLFEQFLAPVMSLAPFEAATRSHGLEALLMAASIGIAVGGWALARFLYKDGAATAARLAAWKARFALVHEVVFNKYYVDEIYQLLVVRPTLALARGLALFDKVVIDGTVNACGYLTRGSAWLTGAIDRVFVDGAVNLVGAGVIRVGRLGQRLQTGRVNHYVLGVVVGVIVLFLLGQVVR